MKKLFVVLILVGLVSGAAAGQQLFSVSTGMAFAYNLEQNDIGFGQSLAVDFKVSDAVSFGVLKVKGDGVNLWDLSLFRASIGIAGNLGLDILAGDANGNTAAGAGAYYDIFSHDAQDSFYSALRANVGFLWNEAGDELAVAAGFSIRVGY